MQTYFRYVRVLFACLLGISLLWIGLFGGNVAQAGELADRISTFPSWQTKPPVQAAVGDLFYPEWFRGNWTVTSTLIDLVAPLSPKIVTPGFEGNRQYLDRPMTFQVRFITPVPSPGLASFPFLQPIRTQSKGVVSDRAFNSLSLARAYLGETKDSPIIDVKVDPASPNRQITLLKGDRQLVSIVTGRATETPAPGQFITTEMFQQVFRGLPQPYLNQVETTTAYQKMSGSNPRFQADQITAIYLSPQDPNYFQTGQPTFGLQSNFPLEVLQERPVALYRYHLVFSQTTH
ncbi:MAG: hypothetical protein KME16_11405 [Scytolyngbya sp. HA4215-MV1]|jgi:hypothetical protein|nr:hypothetical protein [Scytolyngbya sp. HA4215-MV1]